MKMIFKTIIIALSTISFVHAGSLSTNKVEEIANKYIEACLERNFEAWSSLFVDTGDVSEENFSWAVITKLERVEIEDIDGHDVKLKLVYSKFAEPRWLQLVPDGRIKYGAILYRHPIPSAYNAQKVLTDTYTGKLEDSSIEAQFINLSKTGIPLFELQSDGDSTSQLESLKKIRKWLRENGESWDKSEPKLACPKEEFQILLSY